MHVVCDRVSDYRARGMLTESLRLCTWYVDRESQILSMWYVRVSDHAHGMLTESLRYRAHGMLTQIMHVVHMLTDLVC